MTRTIPRLTRIASASALALALAAGPGELRRLRLEAGQGVDVGFDLAGSAEKGTLRTGEQWQRGLWYGVQALLADRRQRQCRAAGHGVVPTRFLA